MPSRQVIRWLARRGLLHIPRPTYNATVRGKDYPHSSKRQQERNARQIAAGKLAFA